MSSIEVFLNDLSTNAPLTQPVLVYDMSLVKERIDKLNQIGNNRNTRFLFTLKSFPHEDVIRFFHNNGVGFDISNAHELAMVQGSLSKAKIKPFLSLTGPLSAHSYLNNRKAFIDSASVLSVNMEDLEELEEEIAKNPNVQLGIRLSVNSKGLGRFLDKKIATRFGVDHESKAAFFLNNHGNSIKGIHLHSGLKISSTDFYINLSKELIQFFSNCNFTPESINFGGGLKNISEENIAAMLDEIRNIIPSSIELIFEPGDYWFENAGYAISRPIVTNIEKSFTSMVLNLSKDCHLKWSEPQLSQIKSEKTIKSPILIYGNTCHEGDVIGLFSGNNKSALVASKDEPVVILSNISPYSAAWNSQFNGIPKAKITFYGI